MRKVFCIFTTPIIVKTNHTWQKQWGILQTFQLYAQFQLAFRINLRAIYLSNIRAGKLTGRYFHPWKPQTVARVSEGCLLKGPKKSKTCFFLIITFYHSFGTICRSTSLFTLTCSLAFEVAWQLLSARSLCCALSATATAACRPSNLCWSCLSF